MLESERRTKLKKAMQDHRLLLLEIEVWGGMDELGGPGGWHDRDLEKERRDLYSKIMSLRGVKLHDTGRRI